MKVKKFCIYELIDKLFWIALALFPLIAYLVYIHQNVDGGNILTLEEFLDSVLNINKSESNVFYWDLLRIFEEGGGFFNIFSDFGLFLAPYITYLFALEFIHVMLDVMLFLPRWCHSFMRRYDYGKDKD